MARYVSLSHAHAHALPIPRPPFSFTQVVPARWPEPVTGKWLPANSGYKGVPPNPKP